MVVTQTSGLTCSGLMLDSHLKLENHEKKMTDWSEKVYCSTAEKLFMHSVIFFTVRWLYNLAVSLESCCNQTSWDDIQWSHKNFGREANTVLASYISLMFKAAVTAEAPHCSASFCWDGPWGNRKLLPLTWEGCWWTTCTTSYVWNMRYIHHSIEHLVQHQFAFLDRWWCNS